jgi:CPA2 family monovalent cation:H+ antiporter-2
MHIVQDFSTLLLVAGIAAMVAKVFHFSSLLAYIFCGILLNIEVAGHCLIQDEAIIQQLSELGVVFLMFYMGLEFELKKLRQLFVPSVLALLIQTFFMVFLGRILAPMMGWGGLSGLFLGGLLAISSSMITIPLLEARGVLRKNFANLCVGILIFEDILAIMLLVILSGIAITGLFDWDAIGRVTFFVGAFVASVFFIGRLLSAPLIRVLRRFKSEELLTVVVVGCLMGIGLLAEISHFSIALGAFLAGAIFSGTELSEAIERTTQPVRFLFSAIFFLSVGLTVDASALLANWPVILALTAVVFCLKILSCFIGLFLSGQSAEDSFCASVYKAQIGEFSFVIAALGSGLGVIDGDLLNIAVGVAIGTILCTSLAGPIAGKMYRAAARLTPKSLGRLGGVYHSILVVIRSRISQSTLLKLAAKPAIYIVTNMLLFLSILVAASIAARVVVAIPMLAEYHGLVTIGLWGLTAVASLPCMLQIVRQMNAFLFALAENALSPTSAKSRAQLTLRLGGIFQSAILAIAAIFFGGTFLLVAAPALPTGVPLYAFVLILIVAGLLLRNRVVKLNERLEGYFIDTFNRDVQSQLALQNRLLLKKVREHALVSMELADIRIADGHSGYGTRIRDLALREKFGVNIVALRCGSYLTFSPHPDMPLLRDCELILLGRRENLESARAYFSTPTGKGSGGEASLEDMEVALLGVTVGHPLVGKSLIDSQLRRNYGISVVEIRRGENSVPLPTGTEIFQANDVLVAVGAGAAVHKISSIWEGIGREES